MIRKQKNKVALSYKEISFSLLFFVSCILGLFAINIFKETVIDYKFLIFSSIFGSIIIFILFSKLYKYLYFFIWRLLSSIIIGSSLFSFSFLYINKAFVEKGHIVSVRVFEIIDKGTLGKGRYSNCYKPYVVIDFFGTKKQLEFLCEYQKSINRSKKIRLTFTKGLFGFNVIKSKKLLADEVQ